MGQDSLSMLSTAQRSFGHNRKFSVLWLLMKLANLNRQIAHKNDPINNKAEI